jgi:hypothetical protein
MKESQHGPIIDLELGVLDRLAAEAILRERIPLRGKELHFLRKVLGLSSGTIFHWEKSELERLSIVNEVVIRSFVAEELGVELSGKFSNLIGDKIHQIELKAG